MGYAIYAEDLDKKVGGTVYDPYKREIGILVGYDAELDGRVTKVYIMEFGKQEIRDFSVDSIDVKSGIVILLPTWKSEAEKVYRDYMKIAKRLEAVRELYRRNEISKDLYREFSSKLERMLRDARDRLNKVKEQIRSRKRELEIELDTIARMKVVLKMAYASGDLGREAYSKSLERIAKHEDSVRAELRDLEETLKKLEELEVKPLVTEEKSKERESKSEETSTAIPLGSQGPIPVKIIE